MTERALCIWNFEESSSNSNFYETFPPYLSGIRVSVSARKKKAARRFQRHKGADLTSAFFPPSARIFITEETGALKFFSRLLAQLPLPTLTPFLPREFLQTIHSPRRGCICRYNAVEIAGELPASIFARRFKRGRFFETLLLHSSRFSNEGMIPVIGKKANNFTLQDIIRIFFKFTIIFFLNIFNIDDSWIIEINHVHLIRGEERLAQRADKGEWIFRSLIKLIGLYGKMLGIRVSPYTLYKVHSFNETASTVPGVESFFLFFRMHDTIPLIK